MVFSYGFFPFWVLGRDRKGVGGLMVFFFKKKTLMAFIIIIISIIIWFCMRYHGFYFILF
jgi:hypothetical protein